MNLGQLRTRVIEKLAEQATPQYWTVAEINDNLNRGCREFAKLVGWRTVEATLSHSGSGFYNLPSGLLLPLAVFYNGGKLARIDLDEADKTEAWRTQTGAPLYWMFLNALVRLMPYPSTTTLTSMRFIQSPAIMAADGTEADLPTEYHDAAWKWATSECFSRNGKGQNLEKAKDYISLFFSDTESFKSAFACPFTENLPPAVI